MVTTYPRLSRQKRHYRGFSLVEMIIVVAIIVLLSSIGLVVYSGVNKKTRDSVRIADLTNLNQAITTVMQESSAVNASLLCVGSSGYPCTGKTSPSSSSTRKVDGTGWVSVNFTNIKTITMNVLPVDPLNNSTYHYAYCANNDNYELEAVLEADDGQKMVNDGGCDTNKYEVGTDLTLFCNVGACSY